MPVPTPLPASPRTLDAMTLVSLLAGIGQSGLGILTEYPVQGGIAATLLVLAACLYLHRRHTGERVWTAPALAACAAVAWALLPTPVMLLPIVIGLLLLRLDHAQRGALLGGGLTLVLGVAALVTIDGAGPGDVLREVVGLALILYAVVWIAGLVAESYEAQHRAATLSRERDRALTDLEEAHLALAASVETEKDLVLAQERARAAGELHDGLGHRLTAIRLGLDFADRAWASDPAAARDEVRAARDATAQALQEMRVWVRALSPAPGSGLADAESFEAVADAFRGTGMSVQVRTEGLEAPLPAELSIFAHRLIQEGLTNALRHGSATSVRIDVARDPSGLRISLRDNGSGGVASAAAAGFVESFGLRSLRERAADLGGSFSAGPVVDGFELTAVIRREQESTG